MTAAEVTGRTEQELVEGWRLEELQRAGYPRELAKKLAGRTYVDLHVAVELVERGCPPELALEILV